MAYGQNNFNNNPRMGGNGSFNRQSSSSAPAARQTNDTQTNGVIITNEAMGKYLRTRYWNSCLGLEIGTYAPGTPLTFEAIKGAQTFGHVFSFATIFELKEICDEVLESLSQTNMFESTATEAGQKKDVIVEISNGRNINMPTGIYLVIYKNVDGGKRTNSYEAYPFSSTKVLRGYDHNTGSSKEDIRATGNFKKFVKILDEAANAFTMAQAHAVAEVRKTDKLATFTALSSIAAGLGVDISKAVTTSTRPANNSGAPAYRPQQSPSQYQRKSQPGQWNQNRYNNNGNGGYNGGRSNGYSQQQQALAAISDEPVDINLDVASLQNVNLADFS